MAIAVGRRGILPPANRPLIVIDGTPVLCERIDVWTDPPPMTAYGSVLAMPINNGGMTAVTRNGQEYQIKSVMQGTRKSGRPVFYLSTLGTKNRKW